MALGLEPMSVRSMVVQISWGEVCTPFRANKLRSLAFGTPHWGDASFVCPHDRGAPEPGFYESNQSNRSLAFADSLYFGPKP